MCQTCTNGYKNIFTATCGNMDGLNEENLLKNSEISQYYNFETTSSNCNNCNNAGYLQSKYLEIYVKALQICIAKKIQ